jgi:ABC-type antimicrobial peptide transport system permease subunit
MIHVSGSGIRASLMGSLLGLLICAGTLRAMRSVLYGVGVYDVPSILTVVAILVLVTLLAASLPTLRIAMIDPASTLRDE